MGFLQDRQIQLRSFHTVGDKVFRPRAGHRRAARRSTPILRVYLACNVPTYPTRFAILCWTCPSFPWLRLVNSGPHTGISCVPWEGGEACPRRIDATCAEGYLPPFFCASMVRSGGGVFKAEAAGPS